MLEVIEQPSELLTLFAGNKQNRDEIFKFTERIKICCSPEAAFDFTQDYNNRLKWDTFLVRAKLIEGAFSAAKGVKPTV